MKRHKMTIRVLSPVHIGSGREVDPLEYVVRELGDYHYFYMLDISRFLQGLSPALRARFDQAVNSPDPLILRRFFIDNIDPEQFCLFSVVAASAFVRAYRANLQNPRNQLLVNLMTRTGPDCRPFLPGSSLKGAIRTAVVSELAAANKPQFDNPRRFENEVLGYRDARQDPFRCLKIADAPLPEDATFIDGVAIFKPERGPGPDPAGIQMFYEQCYSYLDGEEILAETTLDIDDQLPQKRVFDHGRRRASVSTGLTAEQIIKYCRRFYLPKIRAEYNNFYASSEDLSEANKPLMDIDFGHNEFPIRLGRFSHIECVTVDTYRKPGGAAARRGWGKTRTLSGDRMAMGWAKVTLEPIR